jgi:hypothetical protein
MNGDEVNCIFVSSAEQSVKDVSVELINAGGFPPVYVFAQKPL